MRNQTHTETTTAKAVILAGLKKILSTKKEPSLTDFIKENNLRSFRSKHCKFAVRVSVITETGKEVYAYGNTMHDGFIQLKRKFASV